MGCHCFRDQRVGSSKPQQPHIHAAQIHLKTNRPLNLNLQKMQDGKRPFQQINYIEQENVEYHNFSQSNKSQAEYQKQILALYAKCQYYYAQHDIDTAAPIAKYILHLINQMKTKGFTLQSPNESLVQMSKKLSQIVQQLLDVKHYEREISKGGWQQRSNRNGIKVSIRRDKGDTVGCLVQSQIDVPFQIFIALLSEINLFKEFIPFTQKSEQKKQIGRNRRIGYSLNSIPILSKRQSFFQGIGYNRLHHPEKQLFIFTRSIHDRPDLQTLLQYQCQINKKYVQMDYNYFVVRYRPIKKNLGQVTLAMNVDGKMGFVPVWLLEYVSRDYGQTFFANLVKLSKTYKGSKWQQNIAKNPHFFNFARKAVSQFCQQQQKRAADKTN